MFAIVVPGKTSSMNVRFANATAALQKYREIEADGLHSIDLRNAKGDKITLQDLEDLAAAETEEQPS